MIQWHPLFAQLLRSLVEDYYSVETNVPVGDLPREADILLLRRTATTPPPFHGIWGNLTLWNVLEFKGPSDDPALRDLDLLLEVGLGIDRRLNEQRARDGLPLQERAEVSFWYLANHLGRRFVAEAEQVFGACEALGAGLWRCRFAQHAVFLVSRDGLPVEAETVPLHLVCQEPEQVAIRVAQVLLQQPGWWEQYAVFLVLLHPHLKQEIERMAKLVENEAELDWGPLIQLTGPAKALKQVIQAMGVAEAVKHLGLKEVIAEVGLESLLASLTPEQRAELKQRLQ